jgi:hypothetical protein
MTECLDKIRGQIIEGIGGNPFGLAKDFSLACELGYGQFIWQSANYLGDASPAALSSEASTKTVPQVTGAVDGPDSARDAQSQQDSPPGSGTDADISAPPASFMPDDPDREAKWLAMTLKQKRMFAGTGTPKRTKTKP